MEGSSRRVGLRAGVGLSLVGLTIAGATFFAARRPSSQPIEILPAPTAAPTLTAQPEPTPCPLHVDVAGAVKNPGVYILPADSRVVDAIAAAGGPAEGADLDRINKAVLLQDGAQVHVPRQDEPGPTPPSLSLPPTMTVQTPSTKASTNRLIDPNLATQAELEQLPGVGPAIAQRIIAGRPYGSVEDLLRVDGIGPATLEKIRGSLEVR